MLVSLTVGKVDAGVTVLLTPDKRLIEFPSILLPPNISSGSIVDIAVSRNTSSERAAELAFQSLQDHILSSFGATEPSRPKLRCLNATQTSVVLEWDPIELATADLISLALYRNGQKAGNIPRPREMHSTKISGLAVDTEYTFHLVLRTTAGTYSSEKVAVRTHKMTDLSGITITTGILPAVARENLVKAVERIGAKLTDTVRIDTTHFVTTEGRGIAWEKAVESNIPVVRPEWVAACEQNGRILGVTKFYLDAMRPGPIETSAPAPAPAPVQSPPAHKDLPPTPPPPTSRRTRRRRKSRDRLMRVEEKDAQKVAIRPAALSPSAESKSSSEDDGDGEDGGSRSAQAKPAVSPDGASFQEVEL
ncbi:unnamed protein product [Parascedosporium putredinis]|uniref:Chitin biosynthesis protein n=1 Tax=Parascedosporium putredinis TaxID=1442378 RepID=A0A9P1M5A1_9PEZI|nr:unnamed protein product [Parascedosporium putredinis]CAI7987879.1 unnamed protein product [Parascedosporium putredinis]